MAHLGSDLPAVPLVDARIGGVVEYARQGRERALSLRDDCLSWLPGAAGVAMPALDAITRAWLVRSASPYLDEIRAITSSAGFAGVWFLNGSYQWCCTTLAREEDGAPWLARTLDWPYPGLGRHVEVAHLRGPAGDYFNATWPGYVGALTAMAPGRFAAAINQAPMRRRSAHPWLRPLDLAIEIGATFVRVRHIPPDHLLRHVFETCRSYDEAVDRLERTPVARPVIFTIVGCRAGERRVIERTELHAQSRADDTFTANDWRRATPNWEGRMRADRFLTATTADAAENSRLRCAALAGWNNRFGQSGADLSWVVPPVLNPYTRLAAEMCPATGIFRIAGFETAAGEELPRRVTAIRSVEMAAA